jgi:hypothetical protein
MDTSKPRASYHVGTLLLKVKLVLHACIYIYYEFISVYRVGTHHVHRLLMHAWTAILRQTQGAAACGMCIEVTRVDNMPALNDQLTEWNYKKNISVPFIAMIFDQCTDPICEWNGYLDFVSVLPPCTRTTCEYMVSELCVLRKRSIF